MTREKTSHENFWKGGFGNEYTDRNRHGEKMISCRVGNLAKCLSRADYITASLEIGSNIGYNEIALQRLYPDIQMDVVEINQKAAEECGKIENVHVYNTSIYDFKTEKQYDLTLVNGVLVYIDLEKLDEVYESLYRYSRKYILIIEYYNPVPVNVNYRGHDGQLCKRDFAGEMMEKYPDLDLLDYGFIYHRDKAFPMDDFNWFLLMKR
ncbi:MAG: pseudaminic acid biosynthesis-associated methylase [Lachnospiraceae bacterium]|nr:pseudaminic acid biosynthesis-associated methylase [Lachnospiraceae bacterium]